MPAALEGIRVLDLCIILAGPTCGRTLSEYGAEVIKIDPEHRLPGLTPWLDVGRGKRSICLNIVKDSGREAFLKLADTADVVVQGFRRGVAERLGIGYEQLSERNPRIVYASINAFGQEGQWADRPGFDQNAQAVTGMQLRNGGPDGEPGPPPYTFNDYGTGIMAAYAVMLALLERERTGKGQKVDTSLAYTASTFSSAYMIDYDGYEPNEVEGTAAKGTEPLSRLYRTSDGWIALSADRGDDFARLSGLRQMSHITDPEDVAALEKAFAARGTAYWLDALRSVGVDVVASRTLDEIRADPRPRRSGMIVSEDHPEYGRIEHGGVAQRSSAATASAGGVPVFGGDTEAILTELGYTPTQLNALRAEGVIPSALPALV